MALDNLKTNKDVANESDVLGGSRTLESGVYLMEVEIAYIGKSAGGAMSLNLHLKTENNMVVQQTLWITSGDAKGNKNTYTDRTGKEQYLPGFNQANALCLLTVGDELSDVVDKAEDKVINLYDYDAKKELPSKVAMLTALLGQKIKIGMIKQIVDRNVKNDAGAYVPSGETREENEIDKMFHESDDLTVAEIRAEATEAAFMESWSKKWTGIERNRATATATTGAKAGAPGAAGKPSTSLFS